MRILGVAHTYYMLMTLMQLRVSVFRESSFDIILTNASKNSEDVFFRLKKQDIFDNCYYLYSDKCYIGHDEKIFKKFKRVIENVRNPEEAAYNGGLKIEDYSYDIMLGYVINRHDEQVIFQLIKKCNNDAIYHTFEESFVSYCSINGIFASNGIIRSDKWLALMMKAFGKSKYLLSNNLGTQWFFEKDIVQYRSSAPMKNIPKFDLTDDSLRQILSSVFDFKENSFDGKKFVFLEDSAYLAGKETDDLEILNTIAITVGKDNIIVKLHPRTLDDRFEKLGYHSMKNNIPLEALMFNQKKSSEIVFITMSSSAPLTCMVDFDSKLKVIMLYKCSKYPLSVVKDKNFSSYIKMIQNKYGASSLAIPETINDLRIILEHTKNEHTKIRKE